MSARTLIFGALLLLIPSVASAQVAYTYATSSSEGVTIFQSTGEFAVSLFNAFSTAQNDVLNHNNGSGSPPPSSGFWNNGNFGVVAEDQTNSTTVNRVCYDVDAALGPSPNAVAIANGDNSFSGGSYVLTWNSSTWSVSNSTSHHEVALVCASSALPSPTLSLSSYAATPGQQLTLTWNDTAARDYNSVAATSLSSSPAGMVQGPPDPSYYEGGASNSTAISGKRIITTTYAAPGYPTGAATTVVNTNATNFDDDSAATCTTSSNWSNLVPTPGSFNAANSITGEPNTGVWTAQVRNGACVPLNSQGGTAYGTSDYCTVSGGEPNKCYCNDTYTWSTAEEGQWDVESKSGSVTITAPSSAGSYAYTYTCANPNGSTKITATLTVAAEADLTAGAITPTTATQGSATTFSSTISNTSSGPTGAAFPVLFQSATDSAGDGAANLGTTNAAALGGNASEPVTYSYTPPSHGTIYMRACANTTNNQTFSVTESNYGNNCGAWTAITVAAPAPTASLSATSPIGLGSSSTLTYTCTNSSSGSINNGVGAITADGSAHTTTASPTTTTTYTLTCNGLNGSNPTAQATVTVNVPTLSADAPPQTSGLVNSTTVFTTTTHNTGGAATSGGFPDLFELSATNNPANFSSLEGAYPYPSSGNGPALAAGGSDPNPTGSFYFSSIGTYYIRACANLDTNNQPVVAESNPGSTCSAWVPVVISTYRAPLSVSCGVSAAGGYEGDTFTWIAAGYGGYPPYTYTWTGSGPLNGQTGAQVPLNTYPVGNDYTGAVTAVDSQGNSTGSTPCVGYGSGLTGVAAPEIFYVWPPPPTATLYANGQTGTVNVTYGQSVNFTWQSTNATSCYSYGGFNTNNATNNYPSPGVTVNDVTTSASYEIQCNASLGVAYSTVNINVIHPTATITASPPRVPSGGGTTISWNSTNVASCVESGPGLSASSLTGSQAETITKQSVYTIACEDSNGNPTANGTITVNVNGFFNDF